MSCIISEEELESRLNSPNNLANKLKVTTIERKTRGPEVPQVVRNVVGIISQDESARSVGAAFGIGKSAVNDYSNGQVGQESNPELKTIIQQKREDAEDVAISNLMACLQLIPSKLEGAKKVTDLSKVAKDMSSIAQNLRPKEEKEKEGGIHFHIHAPRQKSLDDYEVIDA